MPPVQFAEPPTVQDYLERCQPGVVDRNKCLPTFSFTLGPAHNELGFRYYLVITSRFLCIRITNCNVKNFGNNEHPLTTSSFFCIFLLVVSGTQRMYPKDMFTICFRLTANWKLARFAGRQVPIFSYFSQHTPIFPIF